MTLQIYISDELKRKAKELNINLSGEFREFLEYRINALQGDTSNINIAILKKELEKITRRSDKLNAHRKSMEQQIKTIEENEEQKKLEDLKKEKEQIEAMGKCINCGSHLEADKKKHNFNAGYVCNGCFSASTGEQVKKWNEETNGESQ